MIYMRYYSTEGIISDKTKVKTEFSYTQKQPEILPMFYCRAKRYRL